MRLDASVGDRALVILSPGALVALGVWGASAGGTVGVVLLVVGVVLGATAGWVMPWSARIDHVGVHRRTLLRRQTIAWDDVVAIERGRPSRRGRVRRDPLGGWMAGTPPTSSGGPGGAAPDRSKGLMVRTVDRKRHVLATHAERPDQWDTLKALVAEHAPGVAPPPPPASHPFSRR
jgi:hypothetical protein